MEEEIKLLHSVLDHLKQVVISIETLLYLNSMMIKEATGHLHGSKRERRNHPVGRRKGAYSSLRSGWHASRFMMESRTVVAMAVEDVTEAGVAALAAEGGQTPIPMKKVCARSNQLMSIELVASLVTRLRSACPKGFKWARLMLLWKRGSGCCWFNQVHWSWFPAL
jgi:hypothetical protein